ncbi:MAG: patatin-like phospholipase family protein [Gemmatimonadales bacterium]
MSGTEFTLVLSGGGMKGLAHVGVLQALEERGLEPSLIVGSSIGALIAATWATGMPLREIVARARLVRRKDVFAVAHADMAFRRMRAPAVYRREPLDDLVSSLVGTYTFRELQRRILVNTVDLESGAQVLWGLPGLDDVSVADAVFASCALPGIFPPRTIRDRTYVDGAVVENLPLRLAATAGRGPIVAVNLNAMGPVDVVREETGQHGFAATYIRGLEVVMLTQNLDRLRNWQRPSLVLVQPRVAHVPMFAFDRADELVDEGRRATLEALDGLAAPLAHLAPGVHPRHAVRVVVDRERCVGCGACALWAPTVFRMDEAGKAEPVAPVHRWSPVDTTYVAHCPTRAISVVPADERRVEKSA